MTSRNEDFGAIKDKKEIELIFKHYFEMLENEGLWEDDKAIMKTTCKVGVKWVSNGKYVVRPNKYGMGGEWRIVDGENHNMWKMTYYNNK